MKDIGADNWQEHLLDNLCEFKNGLWTGKKAPYIHVGVIRNTNFTKDGHLDDTKIAYLDVEVKQYSSRKLEYGDIILEKSGGGPKQAVGRVIPFEKNDGEYSFSNFTSIVRIKDKDKLYHKFLHKLLHFYYISGATEPMQKNSTGIRNLQLKEYKQLQVSFPPLPEQKRIVTILDEAFSRISQAAANAEKNLANARELFESYLNNVFTEKGEGWVEKPLNEIAELIDSLHITPRYIEEGGFPMVRVTDIKKGNLDLSKTRRVDEDTYEKFSKRHKSSIGDIVLSRVGSYGVPAVVESNELFCLGQNTVFIIPNINSYWLYYFLVSPYAKNKIKEFVSGVAQPTISLKSIKQIIVPIPLASDIDVLISGVIGFSEKTKRLESIYNQKLKALTELKQSILQKAFSGELTTEDIPKQANG